jgi:hypothetical protein
MSPKSFDIGNSLLIFLLMVGAIDLFAFVWNSMAKYLGYLLIVLFITFFLGVWLFFALMYNRVNRRVGKLMHEYVKNSIPVKLSTQMLEPYFSETRAELPIRPFAISMLDISSKITKSPEAVTRISRAHNRFTEVLLVGRNGMWLLFVGNIILALVGSILGIMSVIPFRVWFDLSAAILLLHIFANPRSARTTVSIFAWILINFLWISVTLIAATSYLLDFTNVQSLRYTMLLIVLAISILILYARKIKQDLINVQKQALTETPLKMLFLWIFGSHKSTDSLFLGLGALWRLVGTTQFLRDEDFSFEPLALMRPRNFIATTPEEVMARIKGFRTTPHWSGMYYTNVIWCNDAVWQFAFDILLDDTDIVFMDICGFSKQNSGCIYELNNLINRLPTSRFVLLIDQTTDKGFLLQTLRRAWEGMAVNSPNRMPAASPIQIFQTQQVRSEFDQSNSKSDQLNVSIVQAEASHLFDILIEGAVMSRQEGDGCGQPKPSS